MESVFTTLKVERAHHSAYAARDEARRALFASTEGFYNSRRLRCAKRTVTGRRGPHGGLTRPTMSGQDQNRTIKDPTLNPLQQSAGPNS